MNAVNVTVTNRQIGTGPVVPYSHRAGLQVYSGGYKSGQPVVYTVPTYELRIESGGTYAVVRFGLRNKHDKATPQVRPCDSGLHETRVCTPSWLPHYSPHSFRGSSRPGAWQLLPGKVRGRGRRGRAATWNCGGSLRIGPGKSLIAHRLTLVGRSRRGRRSERAADRDPAAAQRGPRWMRAGRWRGTTVRWRRLVGISFLKARVLQAPSPGLLPPGPPGAPFAVVSTRHDHL
jgi:hypothetical protein